MTNYKVVIDTYHLYHLPQIEPVAKLLLKNPKFEVTFTTSHEIDEDERKLALQIFKNNNWNHILGKDEEDRKKKLRAYNPNIYLCGWSRHPLEEFCGEKSICAMLYHGIGIKPSYYLDNHKRLDLRFVEGSFREKQLREYGVKCDLELVGFAKLDPLFNGEIPCQKEILEQLGLDPSKKTILYAPTFYPSSFEIFGTTIGKLTKDYNLIIKHHQWIYFKDQLGGVKLKGQLKLLNKISKKFPKIKIIHPEDYNIIPFYRAADVLLTEASSTIYEMIALQKHVIICNFFKKKLSHKLSEKRIFKRRLDKNMKTDLHDFCYHIDSPKELPDALDKCFNKPDTFVKVREKYIKKMLYKIDGKVSERIVSVLEKRLKR